VEEAMELAEGMTQEDVDDTVRYIVEEVQSIIDSPDNLMLTFSLSTVTTL
jgi:hypothetical protein